MQKFYKTPQIISSTQRDYENFINSCLANNEIRVDAEFLSFLLVGQAEWQKHFKAPLPPLDIGAAVNNLFLISGRETKTGECMAQQELSRHQQFLAGMERHLQSLQEHSVRLIERGEPAMPKNKADYDVAAGHCCTDSMTIASMLWQLECLRGVAIYGDGEVGSGVVQHCSAKLRAWFGLTELERRNGQAKHIALLALYFEAHRIYRWVQSALDTMKCGAALHEELVVAQRAHVVATESLRQRSVHERAANKNEERVENGEGGLAILTMTCFHGLSAFSHATDTHCHLSKEAAGAARRKYEQWEARSATRLRTVCGAVALSIEILAYRWVVMERDRYGAQASALNEIAQSTAPIDHKHSFWDKVMTDTAGEAAESEVWHE
jgi:hypothetical protein